jgi:hypothetical protein
LVNDSRSNVVGVVRISMPAGALVESVEGDVEIRDVSQVDSRPVGELDRDPAVTVRGDGRIAIASAAGQSGRSGQGGGDRQGTQELHRCLLDSRGLVQGQASAGHPAGVHSFVMLGPGRPGLVTVGRRFRYRDPLL